MNRTRTGLLLLVAATVLCTFVVSRWLQPVHPPPDTSARSGQPPAGRPDAAEARRQIQARVQSHLDWADRECEQSIGIRLQELDRFFDQAKQRTPRFADELLGWGSKWHWLVDRLPFTDPGHHAVFVRQAFARQLFSAEQLQHTIEHLVRALADDWAGIENQLLVRVEADLSNWPRPGLASRPDEKALIEAHDRAVVGSVDQIRASVSANLAADATSLVASEAVAWSALRMAASGGILGTGATGSWATLGISLVVGLAMDQIVSWLWDWWADPRGTLRTALNARLDRLKHDLIEGDAAEPGLRHGLQRAARERASLRRAAVLEGLRRQGGEP